VNNSVMDKLLSMIQQRAINGLDPPEEVHLYDDEIKELVDNYLSHCTPLDTTEMKVLGMKIVRIGG